MHSMSDVANAAPSGSAAAPPDELSRMPMPVEPDGSPEVACGGPMPACAAAWGYVGGAAAASPATPPPAQVGYLVQVEQLQQRLARERSSLQQISASAKQPAPSALGLGGSAVPGAMSPAGALRRQPLSTNEVADPFDNFQRGEMLRTSVDERRAETPANNPAVVTDGGERFVFRHTGGTGGL